MFQHPSEKVLKKINNSYYQAYIHLNKKKSHQSCFFQKQDCRKCHFHTVNLREQNTTGLRIALLSLFQAKMVPKFWHSVSKHLAPHSRTLKIIKHKVVT